MGLSHGRRPHHGRTKHASLGSPSLHGPRSDERSWSACQGRRAVVLLSSRGPRLGAHSTQKAKSTTNQTRNRTIECVSHRFSRLDQCAGWTGIHSHPFTPRTARPWQQGSHSWRAVSDLPFGEAPGLSPRGPCLPCAADPTSSHPYPLLEPLRRAGCGGSSPVHDVDPLAAGPPTLSPMARSTFLVLLALLGLSAAFLPAPQTSLVRPRTSRGERQKRNRSNIMPPASEALPAAK
jgi:hypothetical protein